MSLDSKLNNSYKRDENNDKSKAAEKEINEAAVVALTKKLDSLEHKYIVDSMYIGKWMGIIGIFAWLFSVIVFFCIYFTHDKHLGFFEFGFALITSAGTINCIAVMIAVLKYHNRPFHSK